MKIKILNIQMHEPTKGSEFSAGIDVYSPVDFILEVGETKKIVLGIAIEINNDEVVIMSERSSMGKKGVTSVGNVIDPDYRGEISIVLQNNSKEIHSFVRNDRIGQIIVHKMGNNKIEFVQELPETIRGSDGFGSTGI